jgi:hypothetical protein
MEVHMDKLPHFVWRKLKAAGFDNLHEVRDWMEMHQCYCIYRLQFIPNFGTISSKHVVKRLRELKMI